MNYDKQLAKYARHLDNPKYYEKIINIIDKAEKKNYKFKLFNVYDLERITGEMCAYYDAVPTDEEDKRMIHYFNNTYFLISDKNYVLWTSNNFFGVYIMYIRMKLMILHARIKQAFRPDLYIEIGNVNNEIYFCRGALKAAKALNTDVFNLEEYSVM